MSDDDNYQQKEGDLLMTKPTTMKKPTANVYVNPKAPTCFKDMLAKIFPHANDVRAEEMAGRLRQRLKRRQREEKQP